MSSLTSSTEIDGASSVPTVEVGTNNVNNEASPEAQTTNTQSPASQLTLEGNRDSLTDDYVYVDNVPGTESEEVRNLSNQQSIIAGYISSIPILPSLTSFLQVWLYSDAANGSSVSSNSETSESNTDFVTWLQDTVRGAYTGSIEEEQQFRACLIEAISDNFDALQGVAHNFLEENSSVTQEEMSYARSSEPQCSRRLLLMLLQRDTRTMLMFLFRLHNLASDIVGRVVISLHQNLESGLTRKVQCLRCILEERVSICAISDHLPKCDSGLLMFVNIVSEEDQPAKPSVSRRLWNKLFEIVKDSVLYQKVIQIITSAIESCGCHTDIVRMLKEEMETAGSCFICRCNDTRGVQTCGILGSQENLEPSMSSGADGESSALGESGVAEVQKTEGNEIGIAGTDTTHLSAGDYKCENIGNETVATTSTEINGASGCAEDKEQPKGHIDNQNTANQHPPRQQWKRGSNGYQEQKRKVPELGSDNETTKYNTSGRKKRKELSSGNGSKEKRRRNDGEEKSCSSSFGNCDLQIEMLKIAILGQENQPDSGLSSLPSTISYVDSGMYEQSTICSDGDNDDETVPKQIAIDLNPPALHSQNDDETVPKVIAFDLKSPPLHTAKDQHKGTGVGQVRESTHEDQIKTDLARQTYQESDLISTEDQSVEYSDASYEHDINVDTDSQDGMLTLTTSENVKEKKYETK